MHIAVINLASQPQRWAHAQSQFQALGLQALRHEAVAGDRLQAAEGAGLYSPELNRRQYHKPLRPGEIGCYASHMALWRRLAASGERMMAIFEDDVALDPALPEVLDRVAALDLPWDVIKLYGRTHEQVHQRLPCGPGLSLVRYQRVPSHTCAYLLSRRGAHKLLATRRPFGRPVDIDLRHWWENDLALFGLQPYPVRLAEALSRQSCIDTRRGCAGLGMRLHKLALQAGYTLHNWQALRRLGDAATPAAAPGAGAVAADAATRPDAGTADAAARQHVA